jgi:hypothetical protein
MADHVSIENGAGLSRATCGWKKKALAIERVRPYWRDVHSPAITRRAGIYEYRHSPYDAVRPDVLAPVAGVSYVCDPEAQLMWVSDVRYRDEAGLAEFTASPEPAVKALILADIELIVDKSTTYRSVGENTRTLIDTTGRPAPQGPVAWPTYGIYFRQRGDEASFRRCVETIAHRWATTTGVLRVRVNLFDVPDMEVERKAGYPIKTHPVSQQYQAWIDLVISHDGVGRRLLSDADGVDYQQHVSDIHVYPVPAVYTFVYAARPTLVGLRGYAAYEAIRGLDGANQLQVGLLDWMYGPVVQGGPLA